jgi:hypothetical protein
MSGSTVTMTTQSKTANKSSSKGTTSKRKGSLDSDEPKKKMGCPQIELAADDTVLLDCPGVVLVTFGGVCGKHLHNSS